MGSAQISYTYHQHSSTCYKSCTVTHSVSASYQVEGGWYRTNTWRHSSCGQRTQTSTENVTAYGYTEAGSSTSTHQYLICGKSTTTPISATITF